MATDLVLAGPSPAAVAAAATADVTRPPDPDSTRLRHALSRHYRLPSDAFVVGPGVASLLHGVIARRAAGGHRRRVVYSAPSFHLYAQLARDYGLAARPVPLHDYHHDLTALGEAVSAEAALVLLDSPHNVTATAVAVEDVLRIARHAEPGSVVLYDNVYGEYEDRDDTDQRRGIQAVVSSGLPVMVARSFSKAHQLFGLRVGYLIGAPAVLAAYGPVVLRYDVAGPAQHAAEASLGDLDTLHANAQIIGASRRQVTAMLREAGHHCVASQSSSILINAGDRTDRLLQALRGAGCRVIAVDEHHLAGHLQLLLHARTPEQVRCALSSIAEAT